MRHLYLFLSASFLSLASTATAQTTWHVDVQATGPGTGTLGDPFISIQQAIDAPTVLSGDQVSVAPGTYAEFINYNGKSLSIASTDGPLHTTIVPPQSIPNTPLVDMSTASPFLEGFTVSGLPGFDSQGITGLSGVVRRCIIRDHKQPDPEDGWGAKSQFDLFLEECTVTGNQVGIVPGIFFLILYVNNTIVFGNDVDIAGGDPNNLFISYSLWGTESLGQPLNTNTNIPDGNPGFWKADGSDLHLSPGSVAIDAGWPESPMDADGSVIDMGALTYDPTYAPGPIVYCTSKLSSDGCLGSISASGTAGFSTTDPFTISASNVSEFKTGLFFYGLAKNEVPFQGGWLCVLPPTARTPIQSSGSTGGTCSGAYAVDFNAFLQSTLPPFLAPGDLLYGQYWLRDPADPFGSVRTNAVEFGLAP